MDDIQILEEADRDGEAEMLSSIGYSRKAIRYYIQKPYLGALGDANHVSEMKGSCGDTMRIYLKMSGGIIEDATYQVLGCPGAIAAAMAVVDLVKGRSIDLARKIDDHDVFNALEEIPVQKHHCIQLSIKTLHKALDDMRNEDRRNRPDASQSPTHPQTDGTGEMEELRLGDLMPIEEWVALERELYRRSGLNASVFDTEGIRITDFKKWANSLCPAIKADRKGQTFICSVAHQNLAAQAKKTGKPAVGECDAGLLKVVVPIFLNSHFLGVMGGCGLLADGSEVDDFVIGKTTDLTDPDISRLSEGIDRMDDDGIAATVSLLEDERNRIVRAYQTHVTPSG